MGSSVDFVSGLPDVSFVSGIPYVSFLSGVPDVSFVSGIPYVADNAGADASFFYLVDKTFGAGNVELTDSGGNNLIADDGPGTFGAAVHSATVTLESS
tara:strand:- start:104 stop:397 length:294 start_codon:yes stop_codon:yes gene_type:complete